MRNTNNCLGGLSSFFTCDCFKSLRTQQTLKWHNRYSYGMGEIMSKCIAYGRWLQQVGLSRSRRSRNSRRLVRGPDRGAMQCNHLAIWWGTGGISTRKVHGPRKAIRLSVRLGTHGCTATLSIIVEEGIVFLFGTTQILVQSLKIT